MQHEAVDTKNAGAIVAIPALGYHDARAAIEWLEAAFGAEARNVIPGPDKSIAHAELWIGNACIMMGSIAGTPMPPTVPGQGALYIPMREEAEVHAVYALAQARSARIVTPLARTPYGSEQFGVLDVEGNYWTFGTYVPR